jgi:serine-type D-Ala-D-Ala carboxypeptidase (penicillin-binding protein 5/6)
MKLDAANITLITMKLLKHLILGLAAARRFGLAGLALLLCAGQPMAQAATRSSKSTAPSSSAPASRKSIARDPYLGAIIVDAASGKVLFEDQADAKGYPASVLKLMDLLIILEKIEQKQLSLTNQVPVSAKASHIGGSRVWLAEKESFTLDDMLYALMVQSANDAATALAEKVAGSTDAFVELMNRRAKELGMVNTVFHSVHGLPPGKGQEHDITTARDLSILCRELLKHPDTLRYTSTRAHAFRTNVPTKTIQMTTHNHLLGHVEGCDGLKTGYIAQSGYSIAVTAARHGQRVIVVVLDSTTLKVRDTKAAELVAKGFAALPAASQTAAAPASPATAASVKGQKK